MLSENTTRERSAEPSEAYLVRISRPDPVREGVIDVLTLRGLMRALKAILKQSETDDFQRALAKVINLNGAIAQAVDVERNRRQASDSSAATTAER